MNAINLIRECQKRDITLSVTDSGEVTYRAPRGALDNELKERLKASKDFIAEALKEPEKHRVISYSKVLSRDIVISWAGDNPKVVYVDRTPYATDEIEKLKNAKPEDVRATHAVKETFQGTIVDEDEGHT